MLYISLLILFAFIAAGILIYFAVSASKSNNNCPYGRCPKNSCSCRSRSSQCGQFKYGDSSNNNNPGDDFIDAIDDFSENVSDTVNNITDSFSKVSDQINQFVNPPNGSKLPDYDPRNLWAQNNRRYGSPYALISSDVDYIRKNVDPHFHLNPMPARFYRDPMFSSGNVVNCNASIDCEYVAGYPSCINNKCSCSGNSCLDSGSSTKQTCNTNTGLCVQCLDQSGCSDGQHCDMTSYMCVADPKCKTNNDCAKGYYCDSQTNQCAQGCSNASDCPTGDYCNTSTHQCIPNSPDSGRCTSDNDCQKGYSCDKSTNQCIPSAPISPECSDSDPCAKGYYCNKKHQCEPLVTPGCKTDSDCAVNEFCNDGTCNCSNSKACRNGEYCNNGTCEKGCDSTTTCGKNRHCDLATNNCVKDDKDGLSAGAIAGIVISSFIVLIIIVVGAGYYFTNKSGYVFYNQGPGKYYKNPEASELSLEQKEWMEQQQMFTPPEQKSEERSLTAIPTSLPSLKPIEIAPEEIKSGVIEMWVDNIPVWDETQLTPGFHIKPRRHFKNIEEIEEYISTENLPENAKIFYNVRVDNGWKLCTSVDQCQQILHNLNNPEYYAVRQPKRNEPTVTQPKQKETGSFFSNPIFRSLINLDIFSGN